MESWPPPLRRAGRRARMAAGMPDLEARPLRTRLLPPVSLVAAVLAAGTGGYTWLWWDSGGTWLDALYMTVTTVTTIGYGEVRPLTSAGRVFTMALALTGVGAFFYTFGVVMEHLMAVRLADPGGRRTMRRRIAELKGHVIVAGLGRVGRQAAAELREARTPFVVVDPREAAVRHARGLIVTTGHDATNMYIVLSARVLNPSLHIVTRAVDEASVTKLIRAGANRAISPYAIGGHRLAHLILSPTVVDFFETALRRGNEALAIEDLAVPAASAAVDRTLDSLDLRGATGVSVLAILRDGSPLVNPAGDLVLRAGDQVLALGTTAQLARLEALLVPR